MARSRLHLQVLTTDPLDDQRSGQRLVELVADLLPAAAPRRWGLLEATTPWDDGAAAAMFAPATSAASRMPVWTGTGLSRPTVTLRRRRADETHSSIHVELIPEHASSDEVAALLRGLASELPVTYGFAHRLGPADTRHPLNPAVSLDGRPAPGDPPTPAGPDGYTVSVSVHLLRRFLPDLWWANVFGPELTGLIGAERLAGAPAAEAAAVGGGWSVRMTGDLQDTVDDPDGFESGRASAKAHLGDDLWWDRAHPGDRYKPGPDDARYRAVALVGPGPSS